jgi:hypothetical protein
MPGLISVAEFVKEAREDQASPTTSTFLHRIPQCRDTVNKLDEVRGDRLLTVCEMGGTGGVCVSGFEINKIHPPICGGLYTLSPMFIESIFK